jgi:glycyl-tRNA synthetase
MILPPFCIHQTGKSFRREQDQVSKNMRLKEFYQQEFQCIYAADTLNDYQEKVLEPLRAMFEKIIGKTARIVESDRLPSYSLRTMDIEIDNDDKWMEICSISKRTDFPQKVKFQTKSGSIEKEMLVLEIAIGLDRCVYNYFK